MHDETPAPAPSVLRTRARRVAARVPGLHALLRLALETFRTCMRYRVTGLASEVGFFALLSFPPLVYGLLGLVGYVGQAAGGRTVDDVVAQIERAMENVLSEEALRTVLMPTLKDALAGGRPDVVSVGFLIALWSGSRMVNVLIDTISIMYGQGGKRGIVRTRILSTSLYVVALVFMAVVLPLIVMGPDLIARLLPPGLLFVMSLYWPVVGGLTILAFATLFYIATPERTPWIRDVPGAAFTLIAWVVISVCLRMWLADSVGGITIYGPLAATIIVLIWLYFLSISVLIGAALNTAVATLWPASAPVGVRARTKEIVGEQVAKVLARRGGDAEQAREIDESYVTAAPFNQDDTSSRGARHRRPSQHATGDLQPVAEPPVPVPDADPDVTTDSVEKRSA